MSTLLTNPTTPTPANPHLPHAAIPSEVDLILSAMEAGHETRKNRRASDRLPWRAQAIVRLFVDQAGAAPRIVYTRDVHHRSLGFVTKERLPLGYGGMIDLPAKDGTIVSLACTVLRCRQTANGWYEGVVYFNREQTGLEKWIG